MAYEELIGRHVTSYGKSRYLEELSTQKNLLAVCLYIPDFGYYLSSQWVGATSNPSTWPDIDEAPAGNHLSTQLEQKSDGMPRIWPAYWQKWA